MNRQEFLAHLLRKQNTVPVKKGDGQDCYICKDEYGTPSSETETGERQVRLPCSDKHTVGANCIVKWLQSNNSCPVCRKELFPKEKTNRERAEPELIDFLDDEDVESDVEDDDDEEYVDDGEATDEEDVNMSDADECVTEDEESDGDEEE